MSNFKIGDRVKILEELSNHGNALLIRVGDVLEVKKVESYPDRIWLDGIGKRIGIDETRTGWWLDSGDYYKVKIIDKNMGNIKEKFTLAFKKEPEKSFRKAGITNGDDFLTSDGQEIFLGWLLKEHGEKFKKDVVDDLLKTDNEEKE